MPKHQKTFWVRFLFEPITFFFFWISSFSSSSPYLFFSFPFSLRVSSLHLRFPFFFLLIFTMSPPWFLPSLSVVFSSCFSCLYFQFLFFSLSLTHTHSFWNKHHSISNYMTNTLLLSHVFINQQLSLMQSHHFSAPNNGYLWKLHPAFYESGSLPLSPQPILNQVFLFSFCCNSFLLFNGRHLSQMETFCQPTFLLSLLHFLSTNQVAHSSLSAFSLKLITFFYLHLQKLGWHLIYSVPNNINYITSPTLKCPLCLHLFLHIDD